MSKEEKDGKSIISSAAETAPSSVDTANGDFVDDYLKRSRRADDAVAKLVTSLSDMQSAVEVIRYVFVTIEYSDLHWITTDILSFFSSMSLSSS